MKFIDDEILNYSIAKSNKPSQLCDELENYTRQNVDMSMMLIGKLEASFLGFLIRSHHVKRVLEIGTFTGYSALAMAEHLPKDGELITLDINKENGKIAKDFWSNSQDGYKIKQIIAPALETINKLEGKFDLIFVDADKENYLNYVKAALPLLSSSGIIILDNVLWSGRVIDSSDTNSSTLGIREVNDFVASNEELYGTLLPIRDGIFIIQKLK